MGERKLRKWHDPVVLARWRAEYHPCENGVHVYQPEGGEFGGITVRNYPGATLAIFAEHSSAGEGDDYDLICDLVVDGSLVDDVCIRRQDLELIDRAISGRSALEASNPPLPTKPISGI
jgi:hypothetical protein